MIKTEEKTFPQTTQKKNLLSIEFEDTFPRLQQKFSQKKKSNQSKLC